MSITEDVPLGNLQSSKRNGWKTVLSKCTHLFKPLPRSQRIQGRSWDYDRVSATAKVGPRLGVGVKQLGPCGEGGPCGWSVDRRAAS